MKAFGIKKAVDDRFKNIPNLLPLYRVVKTCYQHIDRYVKKKCQLYGNFKTAFDAVMFNFLKKLLTDACGFGNFLKT